MTLIAEQIAVAYESTNENQGINVIALHEDVVGETRAAIYMLLGAGIRRILRQLMTERMLLALCGGLAGLLIALWGVDALLLSSDRMHRISFGA